MAKVLYPARLNLATAAERWGRALSTKTGIHIVLTRSGGIDHGHILIGRQINDVRDEVHVTIRKREISTAAGVIATEMRRSKIPLAR